MSVKYYFISVFFITALSLGSSYGDTNVLENPGFDSGPGPYDLLLAGLGACTAMTLRMYAERKKLPLENVSVELRHAKIHAADCKTCETKEGKVDRIERAIDLRGALTDAQRARFLEIADKCPVHRTLHSEVTVSSVLRDRTEA